MDYLLFLVVYVTGVRVQRSCVFSDDSLEYHSGQRFSAKERDQVNARGDITVPSCIKGPGGSTAITRVI